MNLGMNVPLAAAGIDRGVPALDPSMALRALPQNMQATSGMNALAGLLALNKPQEAAEYHRGLLSMPLPMQAAQPVSEVLQGVVGDAEAAQGQADEDAAARNAILQQARGLYTQAQPWQQYDLSGRNVNTWQTRGGELAGLVQENPWLRGELQSMAPKGHAAFDPRFFQYAGGGGGTPAPAGFSLNTIPSSKVRNEVRR